MVTPAVDANEDAPVAPEAEPKKFSWIQPRKPSPSMLKELVLLQQGRQAAADHHHNLGRRMMEEGRLPQAIEQLKLAVDYFPNNEDYRRSP